MTEVEELKREVNELKTKLAGISPAARQLVTNKFLEFPGETGTKALAWIQNAEATIKLGGFQNDGAKLGAVRTSMAKSVTGTKWFDNLKDTDKASWDKFRAAYNKRWEIELDIYQKCDLFLKCTQKKEVSVKQFKDECLDTIHHYFEGLVPKPAPTSGAGSTTLKNYNKGYFDCISHIQFVLFINGLLPEISIS